MDEMFFFNTVLYKWKIKYGIFYIICYIMLVTYTVPILYDYRFDNTHTFITNFV